eukprot:TRINITY_DN16960_c0_g1_i1.p1 TRINITY_DN16960_c0_g1~~TRINITY_DN16960_c0_g1_i1.p1  ORF type:complete len:576 (+),score=97.23 TRINITY_DN16960_c0_g1_i1:197-1924(+)
MPAAEPKAKDAKAKAASETEDGAKAGLERMKPRHCTDILWAIIFIAAVGFYCYVMSYARSNGQPELFEQLYNTSTQATQLAQGQTEQYKDQLSKLVATVMEVLNSWQLLLFAAFLSLVIGCIFLFLVKKFATLIVHIFLGILVLCPTVAGLYLVYVSLKDPTLPGLGPPQVNLYAGAAAILIGLVLAAIACCSTKSITLAIDCVQVAVNCTFDMPTMLIAPALHFLALLILVPAMCSAFVYLLSCGKFTAPDAGALASAAVNNDAGQAASAGGVEYSTEQFVYIGFSFFMIFWIIELCAAFSQFSMAYSVVLWYFAPYDDGKKRAVPLCSFLQGFLDAARYHLGTLACGSFFVAVFGAIQAILSFFERQAAAQGNLVGRIIAAVCGCFVSCFKCILELVNKNAYIDVAINSSTYCEAVKAVVKILVSYGGSVAVLTGTMWIMKFAAVGAIAGSTGWIMFMYLSSSGQNDAMSLAIGAALVASFVALNIMNVLDMVAETILYCFASDEEEQKEAADASCAGRLLGCCGQQWVAEKASATYHSASAAKAMGKVGLDGKAPAQYVPVELRPMMEKHTS